LLPEIGLLWETRNSSSFLCGAAGDEQSGRKWRTQYEGARKKKDHNMQEERFGTEK